MRFSSAFLFFLAFVGYSFLSNADGITSISKTNKLLKQAEEAFKKKDFKTAILAYENAQKETSELPAQVKMNLASAYFQTKDYSRSQKNYQAAISTLNSPGLKSVAYQQIGNIFSEKKDYKSALDWYKKSLKINPENESARFNYELAYKINKKKEEEEQKQNPNKDQKQNPENQKDKEKKEQKGDDKKENQKGKDGKEKDQKGQQDQNKGQKPGEEQKGKGTDGKDGKDPKKGDDPNAPETDKESAIGKEKNKEEKDKDGKEESKNKKEESNVDDPNALRVDKKKLQETGLTEAQAKSLLEAMKQSEVKYLQQRRFKSPKGGTDKSKPKW